MIKYEDIEKANQALKTTEIKGKDYTEVNQRIKAFRMCYPEGTIETEIISLQNGVVTMKSVVKNQDGKVLGTGLAQEKENSTFINKTSFIENCETSSVGRALGMCGFGIDTSVASSEEVTNAINNQEAKIEKPKEYMMTAKQKAIINEMPIEKKKEIASRFGTTSLTMKQATEVISEYLKSKGE